MKKISLFKKFIFSTILSSFFFLFHNQVIASIVAIKLNSSNTTSVRDNLETHIIIASKGLSFASVGYMQAKIYQELYPNNQIIFITSKPDEGSSYRDKKQSDLKKLGYKIVEDNDEILNSRNLLTLIKKYTSTGKIKTLDLISHNGVELGPWLEDGTHRLDFTNSLLMSTLKNYFTTEAYARIHGCNSGWYVAPALSASWGIPVVGNFTSTSFYFLTKNGSYELLSRNSDINLTSSIDNISFLDNQLNIVNTSCPEGRCLNLTPESSPYHFSAHRSEEAAWLPFRKIICNDSIPEKRCQKSLAESLISSISSIPRKQAIIDKNIFIELIAMSICSSLSTSTSQNKCVENMLISFKNNQFNYFPFKYGTILKCSALRDCQFNQVSIDLRKNISGNSVNSIQSYYINAIKGFEELHFSF